MPCRPMCRSGNRAYGSICGPAGRGKSQPPCACGRRGTLLCDGPGQGRKLCSASLCEACSVSIKAQDLDFCRRCAAAAGQDGCLLQHLGPASSDIALCRGVFIEQAQLCVRHLVLFDHWHAFAGGEQVYADGGLTREQRRDEHRQWLRATSGERLREILRARHAPAEVG
jgi:hypothetical protein